MPSFPTKFDHELIQAIALLDGEKEVAAFWRDLLTPAEIEEFSRRWQIAKLLWTTNLPYVEIAHQVGTSTTTVTRVGQWLNKEPWHGYQNILKKIYGPAKR